MSRKKIIIIVSVILGILLLVLIGYYFLIQNNNGSTNTVVNIFKNFFPFGDNGAIEPPPENTGQEPEPNKPIQNNPEQKLREISMEPVAGAGLKDVKAGTIVRHIEKATGHIFETELFSPNQSRISNTTLPLVYDAIWGNNNNSLIARYLKGDDETVDTYSLTLKNTATSTENTVSAIVLPLNIGDVSVLGNSIFYLEQSYDSSTGYILNFDAKNKFQIWDSPIKEVLSQYVNSKTIALTTKPEKNLPGYLYFINTASGKTTKILSDVPGLSTLTSPDGAEVLYIKQGGSVGMLVFNIKSKSTIGLGPVTFPEKCVWSKKQENTLYCAVPRESLPPDSLSSWYKGLVSFTDDIWEYDVESGTASIIEKLLDDSGKHIDVVKPLLSDNEQYLVFINKIDNSLWSLDLTK